MINAKTSIPLYSEKLGHDRDEEVQQRNQKDQPHISNRDLQVVLEEMIVVPCRSRLRIVSNTPVHTQVHLVVEVYVAGVRGEISLVEILYRVRVLRGQEHHQVCAV